MQQNKSKVINFEIVTPEKVVLKDNNVSQITLPTTQGEITILPGHIPLVALLVPGELKIKKGDKDESLAISGGFIEVMINKVVILADTAERAFEIDEKRVEEAKKRAEKLREEKQFDKVEFSALTAKIEKELARAKVARKYRKLHIK